jgi:hypothetical protein
MNWTYYPDIQKSFTGFFSESNIYGKPGKFLIFFAALIIVGFLIPRVWAKRANLLLCTILLAYAIKTFIVYSTCYRGICPQKLPGIWIMLISTIVVLFAALLPNMKLKATNNQQVSET